ncbi:hypothetical protein [Streptomyces sp. NPDC037389]|uniref:hypothetical protein n=1 Tax=Streptomyces sp. NPDC037389 TaxID=3155369 RepID=UPI0033DBB1B9
MQLVDDAPRYSRDRKPSGEVMVQLLGVLLGGVLTLVGSLGAASWQARQQRELTRAKDLWDCRAGLYLDLLKHLRGMVSFAADSDPFLVGYGPRSAEDYQLRHELRARVALFASQEVRDHWSTAADAALRLHAETIEGDHLSRVGDQVIVPGTSEDPAYARLVATEEEARAQLIKRLRAELEVDRYLAG